MHSQTRRLKAHSRHLQALELRKAGATYQAIADQLGYANAQGAHKAVASALKATLREAAEDVRELELTRLDTMLLGLWWRVQAVDEKAVDRAPVSRSDAASCSASTRRRPTSTSPSR
jgi:hypothetical protein